jgi:hypothetical protein
VILLSLDTSAFEILSREWPKAHRKAVVAAMKGEGYRLHTVLRNRFMRGPFDHLAAPLTRAERKNYRSEVGRLRWLGNKIAYRVTDLDGLNPELAVGPAQWQRSGAKGDMRTTRNTLSLPTLIQLAVGGGHTVTRQQQNEMAYKIRRGWKEPVAKPGMGLLDAAAAGGKGWRRKRGSLRRKWKEIPQGMLPRVGASLRWPHDPWATRVENEERAKSREYIAKLYRMSLGGERWAREWWT